MRTQGEWEGVGPAPSADIALHAFARGDFVELWRSADRPTPGTVYGNRGLLADLDGDGRAELVLVEAAGAERMDGEPPGPWLVVLRWDQDSFVPWLRVDLPGAWDGITLVGAGRLLDGADGQVVAGFFTRDGQERRRRYAVLAREGQSIRVVAQTGPAGGRAVVVPGAGPEDPAVLYFSDVYRVVDQAAPFSVDGEEPHLVLAVDSPARNRVVLLRPTGGGYAEVWASDPLGHYGFSSLSVVDIDGRKPPELLVTSGDGFYALARFFNVFATKIPADEPSLRLR